MLRDHRNKNMALSSNGRVEGRPRINLKDKRNCMCPLRPSWGSFCHGEGSRLDEAYLLLLFQETSWGLVGEGGRGLRQGGEQR